VEGKGSQGEGEDYGRRLKKLESKPTASSEPQRDERRSERIFKKKNHPYEKESRKCEAYRFFVAYKRRGETKKLMFGGRSPVLLVGGGRKGPTIHS